MSEQHHTFLFADLAGFTALTEAHGDEVAADIALQFCADVNELLPEGAEDLKMLGDACLIRTSHARDAVQLGIELTGTVAARHGFPDVSVGMHTGTAARRGRDWFGSAVNLAARIGAHAGAREVLLSAATRDAAGSLPDAAFEDQGEHELRHVSRPVRIFAAVPTRAAAAAGWPVDPVCRMRVDPARPAATVEHLGVEFLFCSAACAERFATDPDRFAGSPRG